MGPRSSNNKQTTHKIDTHNEGVKIERVERVVSVCSVALKNQKDKKSDAYTESEQQADNAHNRHTHCVRANSTRRKGGGRVFNWHVCTTDLTRAGKKRSVIIAALSLYLLTHVFIACGSACACLRVCFICCVSRLGK